MAMLLLRALLLSCLAACTPATDLSPTVGDGGRPPSAAPPRPAGAGTLVQPTPQSRAPPNLAAVVLRLPLALRPGPGGIAPHLELAPDGGPAVATGPAAALPCAAPAVTGGPSPASGSCYAFPLVAPLARSRYQASLPPGTFYDGGAAVSATPAGAFVVDDVPPDRTAPTVELPTVELTGDCLRVRFHADEPARATVLIRAPPGETTLAIVDLPDGVLDADLVGRPPGMTDGAVSLLVQAVDWAGNTAASSPVAIDLLAAPPPLVITEVLANPAASELTQEFVELFNRGAAPVGTDGLTIEDGGGADPLPAGVLAPGGYALVVAAGFVASGTLDPEPRDGTLLLRVDGRIGRDGLSNGGEPVRLRARSDGRVVSAYGGWVDGGAATWNGRSVKRTSPDACDLPSAWTDRPSPPTPGW